MKIVGMISAYKEGRLVHGAIMSLARVGLDALYVFEGPAGEPLGDDVPDSDYDDVIRSSVVTDDYRRVMTGVIFRENRWRTDARKRTEMLKRAQDDFPGEELWGVVLDGDEILHNAEYLRDMIQAVAWDDEAKGASTMTPENTPTARMPLRLIERDGSISLITGRVIRLDLLREYNVSSSLVTNTAGVQEGWGNRPELSPLWIAAWEAAIDKGHLVCWPPFPCEPCIVHRAHLRHPLRRGLRMSAQETVELAKARAEVGVE